MFFSFWYPAAHLRKEKGSEKKYGGFGKSESKPDEPD